MLSDFQVQGASSPYVLKLQSRVHVVPASGIEIYIFGGYKGK
jgi:hypothetical protein